MVFARLQGSPSTSTCWAIIERRIYVRRMQETRPAVDLPVAREP